MEFNLNEIKIEKASVKDSKIILKLLNGSENLIGYKGEIFTLNEVKDYVKQKINLVFVSKFKNKIIAVLIANLWKEYCYLYLLVVEQEYQRLGVGSKMMDCLEKKVKDQGYIGLIIKENNKKMITFVEKRNYIKGDKFVYFHKELNN